ncbi:11980_t:CDS:2 [Funneliformis geosporum]|uniref:11980_t:CDS:1 n=1 Tax=Funneliformis geosporum TaxID=1117311 RepID=A0A9W4T263_9GLOM|nr:11980_t:CDS:2 [Funneliformis geosporum]
MHKMKDTRGINSAAVRNAISREFKIQLSSSNRQKSVSDILEWKNLKRVKDCHQKLFEDDYNAMEYIVKNVFTNVSDGNKSFLSIYAYTAAICDIDVLISRDSIELSDSQAVLKEETPEIERRRKK